MTFYRRTAFIAGSLHVFSTSAEPAGERMGNNILLRNAGQCCDLTHKQSRFRLCSRIQLHGCIFHNDKHFRTSC